MIEQLFRQEGQWRTILERCSSRTSTEDHSELADSARAWIEILDEKIKIDLAAEAAEDENPDLDPMDDMVVPDEPATMPQTKSAQKWPPTRPLSTPHSPHTPSESPSRGRKRRRRCSTPRSERSIEASNERRKSSTPRRDSVSMSRLQELVEGVHERLEAREARLMRCEESLVKHEENLLRHGEHLARRQAAMDKQFDQVVELLRSQLGGRPDPTAPTQASVPAQDS